MTLDPRENQSKAVFAGLQEVEPPPFFAARVMARAKDSRKQTKHLYFWRGLAALSCTAVVALTVYIQSRPQPETLFAFKPYVIHVDLDTAEIQVAASAEVELPEGVSFVSKNEAVRNLRRLRLPVQAGHEGPSRLPFVILSQTLGARPLLVRFYDDQDRLIQVKTLNLHFAEERKG